MHIDLNFQKKIFQINPIDRSLEELFQIKELLSQEGSDFSKFLKDIVDKVIQKKVD